MSSSVTQSRKRRTKGSSFGFDEDLGPELRRNEKIVAAFYDSLKPEPQANVSVRDELLPLPGKEDGYTTVQLVGTTGSGKTTLVR